MDDRQSKVSDAFQEFLSEAPQHAKAWMDAVSALDRASPLDRKTEEPACPAVLAALRLESGVPFHVQEAKEFTRRDHQCHFGRTAGCRPLRYRSSTRGDRCLRSRLKPFS